MLLVALHTHLYSREVRHLYRAASLKHDVYVNLVNGKEVTIPIDQEELYDDFVEVVCLWLEIDLPEGLNNTAVLH